MTDETLTAEEKAQQMDMLLKEEEARIYDVEKQLARLRETQVKFTAELQEFLLWLLWFRVKYKAHTIAKSQLFLLR